MLEVRNLSAAYGKHVALRDASLKVGRGEIVVILGANGAGKSTLLKALSGICEGRVTGSATMQGEEIVGLAPHRIVEAGIALVPEGRGVFGDLTVAENLALGAHPGRAREEEAANLDRALSLFPKLAERRRQVVRTMSGGEQQMVAIGRAMMSSPDLLMLDEPSLGLSPLLCKELFQNLARVRETGIGILLVEQNARASLAIADRGYLLENARIVHEDSAERLRSDKAVQEAYLGGGGAAAPNTAAVPGHGPAKTAAPTARPKPDATPRPASGPTPDQIAAAALAGIGRPAPRPEPAIPVQTTPQPAQIRPAAPPPQPQPQPAPPGRDRVHGLAIADLVAEAAAASRARHGAAASPRSAPRPASSGARANPPSPTVAMGDSADRLKTVLNEIEEAAARARAWRPSTRSK